MSFNLLAEAPFPLDHLQQLAVALARGPGARGASSGGWGLRLRCQLCQLLELQLQVVLLELLQLELSLSLNLLLRLHLGTSEGGTAGSLREGVKLERQREKRILLFC